MLIVNNKYESLDRILNGLCCVNETAQSDRFESKCARYLRKQFPNHKFTVKGGSNNQVSDILVDDKFYIECKMTENGDSKAGAQSTGFGLKIADNKFECSDTAEENESAVKMLDYINSNFSEFSKFNEPLSGNLDLDLDPSVFAEWISNYYSNKNVPFFIISHSDGYAIFKNTPANLLKYCNISATVRYYKYGTKNLPISQRDVALSALKKKYNISSVRYNNRECYVKTKDTVDSEYFDVDDLHLYISSKNQKPGEYRIMKLSGIGTPRVLFSLHSKADQDEADLKQFEDYINK